MNYKFGTITFHGDKITCAIYQQTGEVHVSPVDMLAAITFNDKQIRAFISEWSKFDSKISDGLVYLKYGDCRREFIRLDKLAVALNSMEIPDSGNTTLVKKLQLYKSEFVNYVFHCFSDENDDLKVPAVATPTVSAPLSREEIAAYMLYEEQHVDQIEKSTLGFMENQTHLIKTFMESVLAMQKEFQNTALNLIMSAINLSESCKKESAAESHEAESAAVKTPEVPAAETPDTPAPKTPDTSDADNVAEMWKRKIIKKLDKHCKKHPQQSRSKLFVSIYDEMAKCGTNPYSLRNEYCHKYNQTYSSIAIITVIAMKDVWRDEFETAMYKFVEKEQEPTYLNRAPKVITDAISPLIFNGKASAPVYALVYREMEKHMNGVKLADLLDAYRCKNNRKSICTARMIAETPQLLSLFKEAVNDLL